MKKIALTSLLAVFAVSAASAATTPYVAAHIGYDAPTMTAYDNHSHGGVFFNDDFAYDMSIAAGVKYDLNKAFAVRGELEYDFANGFVVHDEDEATDTWLRTNTVLLNAYVDMKTLSALTPYFGAGIGYQWNHMDDPDGFKPHSLAWQVGAGVSYVLSDHMSLDLGYRYLSSVDKMNDGDDLKVRTTYHQFRLGAAYAF